MTMIENEIDKIKSDENNEKYREITNIGRKANHRSTSRR